MEALSKLFPAPFALRLTIFMLIVSLLAMNGVALWFDLVELKITPKNHPDLALCLTAEIVGIIFLLIPSFVWMCAEDAGPPNNS